MDKIITNMIISNAVLLDLDAYGFKYSSALLSGFALNKTTSLIICKIYENKNILLLSKVKKGLSQGAMIEFQY